MVRLAVRWTTRASKRLDQIGTYISAEDEGAADRVILRILSSIELLAQMPFMGRPGRRKGTRELILPDLPYIIPYRITDEELQILSIVHMAQRWPGRL